MERHEFQSVQCPAWHDHTPDDLELIRLGRKPVLKRHFGSLSIVGFACTVLISWEGVLATFLQGLMNGGPAGVVWGYLFVWIGMLSTYASLAELASMAPTAAGQYHWVSMLAPARCRKFLGYITGWLSFATWQALTASTGYLTGTILQGIVTMCNPDYTPTAWQAVLLFWAWITVAVLINTVAGPLLARFEGLILVLHILGFFAIMVPLVYLGPHGSAEDVFTTFLNGGDWPTQGVSFFVGLSGAVFSLNGADCAVHMAEEVHNAGVVVPWTLLGGVFLNGLLAFSMIIAVLFCIGDVQAALDAQQTLGYPFLEIFLQATRSTAGAAIMAALVTTLGFCGLVGAMASASRQLWALARDKGVPLWKRISKLDRRTSIPAIAVGITVAISVALSFIILGSSAAFNDVISLTITSSYFSYLISCSLLLWRRATGAIRPFDDTAVAVGPGSLSWGRWRLPATAGTVNNAFACCYLTVVLIFSCFPATASVTPDSMNYASLVFGGVIIFSILWYMLVARKHYVGPVMEIETEKVEAAA